VENYTECRDRQEKCVVTCITGALPSAGVGNVIKIIIKNPSQ